MSEKTVEELESEYKTLLASKINNMAKEEADKQAIVAAQLVEDAAKAEEEKLTAMFEKQTEVLAAKYNLTPAVVEDPTGDDASGERDTPAEVPKEFGFAQNLMKREGHNVFKAYENIAEDYAANGVAVFTDSDDGCVDDVDSWEDRDYFADVMWSSVLCHSDFLSQNITVRGLDFKAGKGGLVQLRVITNASPSEDFTTANPCTCLSCVSNTFDTYTLTMEMYGDYKVLCDLDLFTAGDVIKTAVMKSMADVAQERIDNKIMTELLTATPTYSETLTASCGGARGSDGACCTYTMDLYDKIVDLEADMRAAGYFRGVDPVVILSPTVAAYLKYKDGLSIPSYISSTITMDGIRLTGIGNIRVIESCHANACTSAGDSAVQAIMIDPSRAIGEAWGKRPTFETDRDPIECHSQKIVLTMWADFGILDSASVGFVYNP